jgi:hypothetical protein
MKSFERFLVSFFRIWETSGSLSEAAMRMRRAFGMAFSPRELRIFRAIWNAHGGELKSMPRGELPPLFWDGKTMREDEPHAARPPAWQELDSHVLREIAAWFRGPGARPDGPEMGPLAYDY